MKFILIILYGILALNTIGETVNFCRANLCPNHKRNIACRNSGRFAPKCPGNARLIRMKRYRKLIVAMHNTRRNLLASGRIRGFKPAKRMATMQWDESLANMAALNVKRCIMKHDKCRNTPRFANSGQNIASVAFTGTKSNIGLIKSGIKNWWKEIRSTNMKQIRRYPRTHKGPAIGHFTAMVRDSNSRVGCAGIRYTKNKKHYFLFTCNYATTNIIGKPIYIPGRTARKCKTGRNKVFTALCSKAEWYDLS